MQNSKNQIDIKTAFIWRRAFRSPDRLVVRSEVVEAFKISTTAASTLLTSVVESSNSLLQRAGNKVIAPTWSTPPRWADENDLMYSLDHGQTSFAETGLRFSELPVSFSSWSSNLPSTPGAMTIIVDALVRKRTAYIQYVGLKVGDIARFRCIYPIALERSGDQWRLVAHDMEISDFPIRTFVISRITGASANLEKLPRGFIPSNPVDYKQNVAINWDLRLNDDQKQALRNELGINSQDVLNINSRDVHEFLIRFGGRAVGSDIAWPPFRKNHNEK